MMAKGRWSKVPRMTAKQQAFVREFLEHQRRHFINAINGVSQMAGDDRAEKYVREAVQYNRNAVGATEYMIAQLTARQPWLLTLTKGADV